MFSFATERPATKYTFGKQAPGGHYSPEVEKTISEGISTLETAFKVVSGKRKSQEVKAPKYDESDLALKDLLDSIDFGKEFDLDAFNKQLDKFESNGKLKPEFRAEKRKTNYQLKKDEKRQRRAWIRSLDKPEHFEYDEDFGITDHPSDYEFDYTSHSQEEFVEFQRNEIVNNDDTQADNNNQNKHNENIVAEPSESTNPINVEEFVKDLENKMTLQKVEQEMDRGRFADLFKLARSFNGSEKTKKIGFIPSGGGKSYLAAHCPGLFVDIDTLPTKKQRIRIKKLVSQAMKRKDDPGSFSLVNLYWNVIVRQNEDKIGNKILLAHHPEQVKFVLKYEGLAVFTERMNPPRGYKYDRNRNEELSLLGKDSLIDTELDKYYVESKFLAIHFFSHFFSEAYGFFLSKKKA